MEAVYWEVNKLLLRTIDLARALQPEKTTGRSFHVATIYDGPRLLSIGYNNYNHEHLRHKYGEYKPTRGSTTKYIPGRHAEIESLRRLKVPCNNLTMCVVRIDRNGELAMSQPCKNCREKLDALNLKRIFFSISESSYGFIKF